MMVITIRIFAIKGFEVIDNAKLAPEPMVVARGYLPSGQELITSGAVPAHERRSAIRSIVEWLLRHRPGWSVEVDDSRLGNTQQVTT